MSESDPFRFPIGERTASRLEEKRQIRMTDEVLNHVGLKRLIDLPAQYLSAGQRKRLGLARLILGLGVRVDPLV